MKVGMYSDAVLPWLVDRMPLSAIYHRHTMISFRTMTNGDKGMTVLDCTHEGNRARRDPELSPRLASNQVLM